MDIKLPTHPVWGRAIGLRRNGAPIYLIQGGSGEGEPPADGGQGNDATTGEPGTTSGETEPPADSTELGEGGKNALTAERAARKAAEKARREAEAKLKAIEDANKTEEQRREERMRELEKDAAKATRYEAANAAGLPLSMAGRLVGDTLEELVADAEALKAELAGVKPAETPPAPPIPKPDRRQGGGQNNATGGSMAAGRDEYRARKQQKAK
ncbi:MULTISPECIES: hypothetical protein [Nocardia]|uniref:Scaffolding protein n=1 Tax=Nocardia nova TaxID=37330 RepID=A0A2T2Z8B8_9NOCA|nr:MULTISPECIES: hypothetical protein [Nocardia]PSR63991.1 hypothetical protein C8259_09080 [Nocardia nova]